LDEITERVWHALIVTKIIAALAATTIACLITMPPAEVPLGQPISPKLLT
jgi:hypothetical protein